MTKERLFLPPLAGIALLLAGAGPSAGLEKAHCAATRAILSEAIAARRAGQSAPAIKTRLTRGAQAVPADYRLTVGPLVDLAFALERAKLTEATAIDYERKCLSYKP